MKLRLLDTTLRDGEQSAGVSFSLKQKVRLAKALDKAGVDLIEAGIPAMGDREIKTLRILGSLGLKAELSAWSRACKSDVDATLKSGIKRIHIGVPVSDIMLKHKLRIRQDQLYGKVLSTLDYALSKGLKVSLGMEDASRADLEFLCHFVSYFSAAGIEQFRFADTVGCLNPFTTYKMIAGLREFTDVTIDFHGHNDLGMATANALAAHKAGAGIISCTVNGLGERAGNTPLEEIAMAVALTEGVDTNIESAMLPKLSKLVEEFSEQKNAPGKPVVGSKVFTHESGIHVDGLLKNEHTYAHLDPKLLGRKHQFVLGKHSGTKSIKEIYRRKGILIDDEKALELLDKVRNK